MKTVGCSLLAFALLSSGTALHAAPQASTQTVDKTPPSYDLKPQALLDLEDMQKKFVSLAQAIPADKYTWRPGAGVRSISEAFLHVADFNFQMPPAIGATPAPDYKKEGFETSTTDKDTVVEQLNRSFDYVRAYIHTMTNADFAKPEKQFGPEANAGDIIYLIVADDHEHLGQSVAYARMNGVVPPWTAARMQKQIKSSQ